MANTYHQMYVQTVFAVKYRDAVLEKKWRGTFFGVMGNLINETGCKNIIVNGVEDHVHCFIGLKPTWAVSDLMKIVKAKSSKWLNETNYLSHRFEWQRGFGCFTYNQSEYNRLSELSGKSVEFSVPDLSETIQIFALIKGFINLNQPNMITPYLYQLQTVDEVAHILEKLQNQEYDTAIGLMDDFTANYTRPVSVTQRELASVKFRIKFLSYQVESLDAEKVETQTELEQFSHRYVIELNPIILKILELKKKIFHKLRKYGVDDSTYEDLENEFRERNQEYEEESENPIADLNEDDQKTIKQLQKEGVRLCHPDSPECVYEDKKEAATMFDNLIKAYKANDIEEVRRLVQDMRLGKVSESTDDYTELEMLKAKLASLEQKYKTLLEELVAIKSSEDFQKMPPQDEWDEYFKEARRQLQYQLEQLKKDYTTPENSLIK